MNQKQFDEFIDGLLLTGMSLNMIKSYIDQLIELWEEMDPLTETITWVDNER